MNRRQRIDRVDTIITIIIVLLGVAFAYGAVWWVTR